MKRIPIECPEEESTSDSSSMSSESISSDGSSVVSVEPEPHLHHYVLAQIVKHLSIRDMKRMRLVNTECNTACEKEFKKRTLIKINGIHHAEFLNVFHADNLISEGLWVTNVNFLEDATAKSWLITNGPRLKTLKLGSPVNHQVIAGNTDRFLSQVFTIWNISFFLKTCPNLKRLIIPAPFSISIHSAFKFKIVPIVSLDYLELGSEDNVFATEDFLSQRGSSSILLNILKCIKTLEKLETVNMDWNNFDGIKSTGALDINGKRVLEKISELRLNTTPMDPRRLITPLNGLLQFSNLRKLTLASFCDTTGEFYFPLLFAALSKQLVHLQFKQCVSHDELRCPNLMDCFPVSMQNLEVFEIQNITHWELPTLQFLQRLPHLKTLNMTVWSYWLGERVTCVLYAELRSRVAVYPTQLQHLNFGFGSINRLIFEQIHRHFPKLRTLETEFHGLDLTPVITTFNGRSIRELTLFINCSFSSDCLQAMVNSGIEKLTMKFKNSLWMRKLNFDVKILMLLCNCEIGSIRELVLSGMKMYRDDYIAVCEALAASGRKITISLFDCVWKVPAQ